MNVEFLTFCGIIKTSFVLTATNIMYSDNELGAYLNPIAPVGYGAENADFVQIPRPILAGDWYGYPANG